jgi:hypothetical protein
VHHRLRLEVVDAEDGDQYATVSVRKGPRA